MCTFSFTSLILQPHYSTTILNLPIVPDYRGFTVLQYVKSYSAAAQTFCHLQLFLVQLVLFFVSYYIVYVVQETAASDPKLQQLLNSLRLSIVYSTTHETPLL